MPLAINSYRTIAKLSDDSESLILAWTLDEREFLDADLDAMIAATLEAEIRSGLDHINRYMVKDPYGEDYLGPAVAGFFEKTEEARCVMCGAGVVSLLQSLASLAQGSTAHIIGNTYPDFPYWIAQSSGRCIPEAECEGPMFDGASLVFLERPSLIGDRFCDLAEVGEVCRRAASSGAIVIIDESNANYYPPQFSAAHLVDEMNNLIVLRGFSKAYGLGGLRLAYCVASNALRDKLRSVIPPLLASSLSLCIGRGVLELGDIGRTLRQRINEAKGETKGLLDRAGLRDVVPSSEHLPYLVVRNSEEYVQTRFEKNGIIGKFHAVWAGARQDATIYRLSVPLRPARMETLKQKIASGSGC